MAEISIKDRLAGLARERIVLIDGATGTELQQYEFEEEDFRSTRFADHDRELKGNLDLLSLTQPDAILRLHKSYLSAGADIVKTNTFSSTSIAQADYNLSGIAPELNLEGARLARQACDQFMVQNPDRQVFVAGAIGPTNRTASISPDVERPGFRAVDFDELREAYAQAAAALVEGGCDLFLIETVFDTLNAKAAIYAIEEVLEEAGRKLPMIVSGTITDQSGRTLSGQTPSAFWHSIRHADPFAIGFNCALGADALKPHLAEIARDADTLISVYPNAGLPNEFGEYDQSPEDMAQQLETYAREGLVNLVGACCGSTPKHIKAIADAVAQYPPREMPQTEPKMRLSGLEPLIHA